MAAAAAGDGEPPVSPYAGTTHGQSRVCKIAVFILTQFLLFSPWLCKAYSLQEFLSTRQFRRLEFSSENTSEEMDGEASSDRIHLSSMTTTEAAASMTMSSCSTGTMRMPLLQNHGPERCAVSFILRCCCRWQVATILPVIFRLCLPRREQSA